MAGRMQVRGEFHACKEVASAHGERSESGSVIATNSILGEEVKGGGCNVHRSK